MTERLAIYSLGTLRVEYQAESLQDRLSKKAVALLIYLAYTRRAQYREQLAEMFWANQPQNNAFGSLRVVLTQLRRELDPFLDTNRQMVELIETENIWLDAYAINEAIDHAEQRLQRAPFLEPADADLLADALSLYKGDFLAGFHIPNADMFDIWAAQEREALLRRVTEGIQYLISSYDKHGLFSQGIPWATRFVQLDNLNEEAYRLLMLMLARSGERRAAQEQYALCQKILDEELGVEPEAETTALYERIRAGHLNPQPRSSQAHNFAPQITPFIGREGEVEQLQKMVAEPNCRLITVTGVGGIGKTRIALNVAESQVDVFNHGVYFVPLASLENAPLLSVTIIDALQLPIAGRSDAHALLADYLRDKQMLLVLDNFEHLLEGTTLLTEILTVAPGIKLLITSREPLNLAEEWLFRVEGMGYPEQATIEALEDSPAAQLFLQYARRVAPNFQLSSDPQSVRRICQLVEGLPLAIELAATWLRVLSPQEVAAQIEHNLDFLTSSLRNVPERHRSIRAVFEQAWEPLSKPEQRALLHLSIFRGGFTLDGAQAIGGATLPMIVGLVEKSLLRSTFSKRYEMHELFRQFAVEKLHASGEFAQTRNQHLDYYIQYTEQAQTHLVGRQRIAGLRLFINDIDNIRLALDWSEHTDVSPECGLKLTAAMYRFWQARGDLTEGYERTSAAVNRAGADQYPELYARALFGAAGFAWWMGNYKLCLTYIDKAIELAIQLEKPAFLGNCLRNRALLWASRGDYAASRGDFERALPLLRDAGEDWGIMLSLTGIEHTTEKLDDQGGTIDSAALQTIEQEAVEAWQGHALPLGNLQSTVNISKQEAQIYLFNTSSTQSVVKWDEGKRIMARAFYKLGRIALDKNNYERAEAYLKDALMIDYECDHQAGMADALDTFAQFAQQTGRFEKAAMLLASAVRLREVNDISPQADIAQRRALFARSLEPDDADTLWLIGSQMSLRDMLSEVMENHWTPL